MYKIKNIINPETKRQITLQILKDLPNWFGIEKAITNYSNEVKPMLFYSAINNEDEVIGFIALKQHNQFTAEIYVMAVMSAYHRKRIGSLLVESASNYCKENKIEFLTIKTLAKSANSEAYEKTRLFYQTLGFKPLEVFDTLWDENNPCLFMIKLITEEK